MQVKVKNIIIMELTYGLEELSHLTNINSEELTQKLTNQETGEPFAPEESKKILNGLFSEKYQKIQKDSIGRGAKQSFKKKTTELAEKYGITPTSDLMSTLDNIIKVKTESSNKGKNKAPANLTKEAAMQIPEVASFIKNLQNENESLQSKMAEQLSGFEREKVLSKVVSEGMKHWLGQNPILSKDTSKRKKQLLAMENSLKQGSYKIGQDGEIVVLDKEGHPLQDSNFKQVSFASHVLDHNLFELAPVDKTKRVPPKNPKGGDSAIQHKFTDEDLTPKGYKTKKKELLDAGKKDAAAELYQQFVSKNFSSK